MIGEIPCSEIRIPCFRTEQGIRRNASDLQVELTPNESKQACAGRFFEKLPDDFSVLRDLAASAGSKTGVEVVRVVDGRSDLTALF